MAFEWDEEKMRELAPHSPEYAAILAEADRFRAAQENRKRAIEGGLYAGIAFATGVRGALILGLIFASPWILAHTRKFSLSPSR